MKSKLLLCVGAGALLVLGAFAIQAAQKLLVNGKVASSDLRIIGGKAYVPLADVAKALDYTIQKTNGGYELIKAGGAGQIANKNVGAVGEEVFSGQWKFTVVSVDRVAEAVPEYLPNEVWNRRTAGNGMEIVVLKCRVKNGTDKKDTIVLDKWEGNNTTLTDMDENAYEPTQHGYDGKFNEHFPDGATFLPGGAVNFNLRFEVPKNAKLKDLVFTVIRYDDRSNTKTKAPTDFRVHLNTDSRIPIPDSRPPG
ncbi:MAG: DUF4352 domain-containing protein [Fimbriimonadaceae bacterium]|nr:DUF4352 domain-containing protein [Chthonomonadaceae bacterium]MCO5297440.1 DUF4352 domain-containing protein [Fimbriimonadaceae bacterium]